MGLNDTLFAVEPEAVALGAGADGDRTCGAAVLGAGTDAERPWTASGLAMDSGLDIGLRCPAATSLVGLPTVDGDESVFVLSPEIPSSDLARIAISTQVTSCSCSLLVSESFGNEASFALPLPLPLLSFWGGEPQTQEPSSSQCHHCLVSVQ